MTHLLARFHNRADIFLRSCIALQDYFLSERNFKLGLSTVCIVLLLPLVSLQGKQIKHRQPSICKCMFMFKISAYVFLFLYIGRACVCKQRWYFHILSPKGTSIFF